MIEKSVFKNVILNIIRVSLSVIFPLITFPYVSRVLMTENLGKVNYALSIESYFALIAALGVSTYAVRDGAAKRNYKEKFSLFANEIFTVNIITTIVSYLLMIVTIVSIKSLHPYALLICLQSISIILTTIGIDWVNSVFEDYLYITVRSFIIQVILLVLMFIFVKKPDDYYMYALLTVLSNGFCCVLNFFYSRRYVTIKLTKKCNFMRHIKKLMIFFANNLAVNLYLNADTTMLGFLVGDYTVGIYAVAVKIYNVVKSVIAAMFTACIPRLSLYYANESYDEFNKLINNVVNLCTLFVFPIVAGLIILAGPIVMALSGSQYIQAKISLIIISFGIIGAIYNGIATNCINLPCKREKFNLRATILAAVINIILNFIFIPLFKEKGAALTTVIAEFTVLVYCIITNKDFFKIIDLKMYVPNVVVSVVEFSLILLEGMLIRKLIFNIYIYMLVMILLSVMEYIILLIITKNKIFDKIVLEKLKK